MTTTTYDFNDSFQDKVAALFIRDFGFYEATRGLILPEYFKSAPTAILVSIVNDFYDQYRTALSPVGLVELLKDAMKGGRVRKDELDDVKNKFATLLQTDMSDRNLIIDKVVGFAKHRAFEQTILNSVAMLKKGDYDGIEKGIKSALSVGAQDIAEYDFFAESDARAERRKLVLSGAIAQTGISTGVKELDQILYQGGYGRGELTVYMAPAKAGKSQMMIYAAYIASMMEKNVLYVTLEVSREITSDRLDALVTSTLMSDLMHDADKIAAKIAQIKQTTKLGQLCIHEFPSGTWSANDAHRLIESYRRKGKVFDMLVVDYLDIMRPNRQNDSPIENSRTIWIDMRALAQENNFAIVSATQTNRDGFSADVAGSIHVADDINRIRTADAVISINATEEEKRKGEARLYLAAMRNSEDGVTIKINTDRSRMTFVTNVISVS